MPLRTGIVHPLDRSLGVDETGGETVHTDAIGRELGGEPDGERVERELRHAVGIASRIRSHRRVVDDRSAAARRHRRPARQRADERADDIDVEHGAPLRQVFDGERHLRVVMVDRRVVDQDVDSTEVVDGALDHGRHRYFVGHVHGDREPAMALGFELVDDRAPAAGSRSAMTTAAPSSANRCA